MTIELPAYGTTRHRDVTTARYGLGRPIRRGDNDENRFDCMRRACGRAARHACGPGLRGPRPSRQEGRIPAAARDRPSRHPTATCRPHAGGLRAGDQARRGLHRAGPRGDEGRASDRATRTEPDRHHRREGPPRVCHAEAHGEHRRRAPKKDGSPPTSRSRRSSGCAQCRTSGSGPQQFNGKFEIPTLEEVIALAKRKSEEEDRPIGIYPEIKHSTYHKSIGLPIEKRLVAILDAAGWNRRKAPVFIQSFEQSNLKELRKMTRVRLVQLVDANDVNPDGSLDFTAPFDRPYDWTVSGDPKLLARTFGFFATDEGLREIKTYADGIGPWKRYIVSTRPRGAAECPRRGEPQAPAADGSHPAGAQGRTPRPHLDVPQRAAAPGLGLRRQPRKRVPAVLQAGDRRRVLGFRRHRGRGPHPARAGAQSGRRALPDRRS